MGGTVGGLENEKENVRRDNKEQTNMQLISTNEWVNYYEDLLTEDRQEFKWDKEVYRKVSLTVKAITMVEFGKNLNQMQNKKSAGPGYIPIELIKHIPQILWKALVFLMNMLLIQRQDVPNEWNTAQVFSIHKKTVKVYLSTIRLSNQN